MNNIRLFINKLLRTTAVAAIIFYTIKINIVEYFIIMILAWTYLFCNYNIKKNIEIFDTFTIISLGSFVSYVCVTIFHYDELINEKFILIYSIILLFILIIVIYSWLLWLEQNHYQYNKRLMHKRELDLDRLLDYLKMFDIIGVNAIWGAGKSFLINELKKRIKDEYEIIEINILTCNLDELQLILIKELEKIMYKHRIISKYSNDLKRFLVGEKIIQKLLNLIFSESYSYSETIKGFKDELDKINKKIIIIYEDIDRISDKKIIEKIFGLSEKLTNSNIKIIYQYDEYKLKEIGFKSDYLEKYIPYKMNLTEINFF